MNASFFETTRIGACLHAEHQSTLRALNDLETLTRAKAAPDTTTPAVAATLTEIARALEDDVQRHFGFEEAELFPLLRTAGAGFMVDMLTAEHEDIRPLATDLAQAARKAVAESFTAAEWAAFRAMAEEVFDRESFHVQKEEMGLLAALSQVLSPEQDAELAARHAAMLSTAS